MHIYIYTYIGKRMGIVDVTHKLVAQEREREQARERRKREIQRDRERQKQGEREKGEGTPASVFKKTGGKNERQRGPRVRLSWGRDAFREFDMDASGMLDAHELGVCVCVCVCAIEAC